MRDNGSQTVICSSAFSQKAANNRNNRPQVWKLAREQLSAKGELFVVANAVNDSVDSHGATEIAINIIHDVYYSNPQADVIMSLQQAFQDANTLLHQIFNGHQPENKVAINCAAVVLTRDGIYYTQTGTSAAYHISKNKIEKLNGVQKTVRSSDKVNSSNHNGFCTEVLKDGDALGFYEQINISIQQKRPLRNGDHFMLCSHNLANLDQEEIKEMVLKRTPQQASRKLVTMADHPGVKNNLIVQIIQVNSASEPSILARLNNLRFFKSNFWRWLLPAFAVLIFVNAALLITKYRELINPPLSDKLAKPVVQPAFNPAQHSNSVIADKVSDSELSATATKSRGQTEFTATSPDNSTRDQNETNLSMTARRSDGPKLNQAVSYPLVAAGAMPVDKLNIIAEMVMGNLKTEELTTIDLAISQDKMIFFNRQKRIKLINQTEYSDLSFQIQTKKLSNSTQGRFGIIFGYRALNRRPYETYYLYAVNGSQVILQKYANFKKQLITTMPVKLDSSSNAQTIQLKVVQYGPYLELHANQQRVFFWQADENIRGRVGIFVDPNTPVEFSKIKSSNSLYLKKMTTSMRLE
ncbi:MAG: PP2C family protein-serine/threonine phosphatase [bacterium]